jgi:hypothetical protein
MEEDMDVEDILKDRPKRIKSGRKGKRVELGLVKDLNDRFSQILSKNPSWGRFSRSIGSGNRWGQNVHLSKTASNVYSGDLVCPDNFRFALESKGGYNEIDLCTVFGGGQAELDSFLKQAESDGERCGRKPMLLWKKDRKPRIAFLKSADAPSRDFTCSLSYGNWVGVPYEELIEEKDEFFFELGVQN